MGPHCCFCGTFTGPFSEIEGLFTVLICIPCLEVRLAQPDTLHGFHDPGQPRDPGSGAAVTRSRLVLGVVGAMPAGARSCGHPFETGGDHGPPKGHHEADA